MEKEKLRLGVSACLLGERVRWDGGHKLDPVLDTLAPIVEWIPVCPEVESGLGVPRPPMHLAGRPAAPHMIVTSTGADVTERMRRFAGYKIGELVRSGLDGYVLKSRSPSCGLDVPVIDGRRERRRRGLWADAVVRRFRGLPVVEESQLADPTTRAAFLTQAFARARRRRRAPIPRGSAPIRGIRSRPRPARRAGRAHDGTRAE